MEPKLAEPTSVPARPAARETTASSVRAAPTSHRRIQVVGPPRTATMDISTMTGEKDGPIEVMTAERMPARYFCRSMPSSLASFREVRKKMKACRTDAMTMTPEVIQRPGLLIIC